MRREPVIQSRIARRPVASPASVAFNQAVQLQDGGKVRRREHANLKRGGEAIGAFTYDEILPKLRQELDQLIESRKLAPTS